MKKLNDIFKIDNLIDYKIKLNIAIGRDMEHMTPAIDVYFDQPLVYRDACAWNGKSKTLNRPYLISFTQMKGKEDLWLFTGLYKVLDYNTAGTKTSAGTLELSKLEEVEEFSCYAGRLIVRYHKSIQQYVLKAENFIDKLDLHQILDSPYNDEYFKGYNKVDLTFNQLRHICKTQNDSWKTALENSKGIYLIRDDKSGKMYVGAAYGEHMLWGRWNDYAKDGHGGNKDLKIIVKDKGLGYIEKHFHYSILEHFISSVDDEKVFERERFWMKILQTRQFGYNN